MSDMGADIAKTIGGYFVKGVLALGGLTALGWLGIEIIKEKNDPTFYFDQAAVKPKHNLVTERVSPKLSIAADFNDSIVYKIHMFSKDTARFDIKPFAEAEKDSTQNAFLQRAKGYLQQGKQKLAQQ